jgi:hypothetical protein
MQDEHYAEYLDELCEEVKRKLSELYWHLGEKQYKKTAIELVNEIDPDYWLAPEERKE